MNSNIFRFNLGSKSELEVAISRSVEVLKSGGVIVHPTDTCYGMAADINNQEAINKVYKLKGRDFNTPLFIIVRNIPEFKKYGEWNSGIKKIIQENPRKMFTFVVPRRKILPDFLNPDFKTVGVQTPKNKFSLSLLKKFGSPLIGTSANISGQPVVYSAEDLLAQFNRAKRYPDLILDVGRLAAKKPSSVVEIKKGKILFLRR